MRQYDLRVNGTDFHVAVKKLSEDRATVEVNGEDYDVEIRRVRRVGLRSEAARASRPPMPTPSATTPATQARPPTGGGGVGSVNAPIPGAVLEIYVKVGDTVKSGQDVLKLEAMKMENVLHAAVDGTVQKVNVAVGDSVAQGQALIEIG